MIFRKRKMAVSKVDPWVVARNEAGVVMDLQLAPPKASLEEERATLEALFGGYWKLGARVEKAAVAVLGSPLEEIIYLRGRMEARVQAVTQRQLPEQTSKN